MESAGLKVEIALVEDEGPVRPSYYGRVEREPQPPTRVTRVQYDEEWIEFCLTEKVHRVEGPPPTDVDKRLYSWGSRAWAYEPTGELSLQLTNVEQLGVRTRWQDGKRQRLEDCLGAFVAHTSALWLSRSSSSEKTMRDEPSRRREEAQRRHEEEMRRLEEAERQRKEERREKQLEAEVAALASRRGHPRLRESDARRTWRCRCDDGGRAVSPRADAVGAGVCGPHRSPSRTRV